MSFQPLNSKLRSRLLAFVEHHLQYSLNAQLRLLSLVISATHYAEQEPSQEHLILFYVQDNSDENDSNNATVGVDTTRTPAPPFVVAQCMIDFSYSLFLSSKEALSGAVDLLRNEICNAPRCIFAAVEGEYVDALMAICKELRSAPQDAAASSPSERQSHVYIEPTLVWILDDAGNCDDNHNNNDHHVAAAAAADCTNPSLDCVPTLGHLRVEDAQEVDSRWKYRGHTSLPTIQDSIANRPSACIRIASPIGNEPHQLASWAIVRMDLSISSLHTYDQFRGRHYAGLVVRSIAQQIRDLVTSFAAREGGEENQQIFQVLKPYCHIVIGNTASENCFRKLGFSPKQHASWIVCTDN